MKKAIHYAIFVVVAISMFFGWVVSVQAQTVPSTPTPIANNPAATPPPSTAPPSTGVLNVAPEPCRSGQGHLSPAQRVGSYCPDLSKSDPKAKVDQNYPCATSYDAWQRNKSLNFWVDDPEITALGKGGERSRQFLLWTLTNSAIDEHPIILDVWRLSRDISLFLIFLVVIVMGIGIIIGQRNNFKLSIDVSPLIIRIGLLLLFLIFSARIVLLIIQLSDIMMEFFIRTLGVRELFNIFFTDDTSGSVINVSERAYRTFLGCSNLNTDNVEMVRTSKFLIKFTNMTYYFLGIMMILRKVVLWFLLIVSPFITLLAPFVFIRNIGWIWIGVFFQWIFYGPLMSLFLGSLAKIWNSPPVHIPFVFDFSRTHTMSEAVYPTSINIMYGGPAQTVGIWNTSNYVDTFAEYVISLIMLWTVIVLPWWLLRIFRDYCCDGIYSMKNILLSMYDTMRNPGGPGPTPSAPTPRPTGTTGLSMQLPKNIDRDIKQNIHLETIQDIKATRTESIVQSMSLSASNLTDIARLETNDESRQNAQKNIDQLQNPLRAETPTERQKVMNLRDELQSRAVRGDQAAETLSAVTSRSEASQQMQKQKILQSMPQMVPVINNIAVTFSLPKLKTQSIVGKVFNSIASDASLVNTISQETQLPVEKTKQVLTTVSRADTLDRPVQDIVKQTAVETGLKEEQVKQVVMKTALVVKTKQQVTEKVAQEEQVEQQSVKDLVQSQIEAVAEPAKHVEQQVPASKKVSIEDYEEVKKMWIEQYEGGEIPETENITTRDQWIAQDVEKITMILNKITSSDRKLQEQGLDEVGYILPVFMINNLSGEELLVYLKAKIEAAKQVARDLKKEEEIRTKVKQEEDATLVDIDRAAPKAEAEEKMLQEELTIDGEAAAKPTEGPGATTDSETETAATTPSSETPPGPLDEVKRKLEQELS